MEPGTAKGETPGARAKPEVWTEAGDFLLAAESLRDVAAALSQSAKTENLADYKVKFDALTEACVQCHDFTPSSGGRFRFAKGE
jgi:cytochrome c556